MLTKWMMDYKLMNNEKNNNYIMKYKEALLTVHVISKFVTPQETGLQPEYLSWVSRWWEFRSQAEFS